MSKTLIYSPEGQFDAVAGAASIRPVGSLKGLRIGALDNGKAGAARLLSQIGERLAAEVGGEFMGIHRKGSAATPCEPELMSRLAQELDLLVTGTAD